MKKLSELMQRLPQYIIHGEFAATITAITEDSRKVTPGSLFVAVKGVAVDGHAFITDAVQSGAVAVVGQIPYAHLKLPDTCMYIRVPDSRKALGQLYSAWFGEPSDHLTLIGVTGTDGKTTTTNLIYSILTAAGINAGMVSTVNARIGSESYETGLHTTTPPAKDVQQYLADMVADGATHAVLETTSHGLAQQRLSGCEFDAAVVTNITHEHLDYHGTFEAYLAAKAMLFENILVDSYKSPVRRKIAVLNLDDAASYAYLDKYEFPCKYAYSTHNRQADVRAESVNFTAQGLDFELRSPWGGGLVSSPLVGLYNVSNILAAATVTLAYGIPVREVIDGIFAVKSVAGRMESVDTGQDFLAVVDFAHTPNGLKRVLEMARTIISPGNQIIVVFGCAGLRDTDKRWMMGEVAGQLADRIVVTAEDPRTESVQDIMSDIEKGLLKHHRLAGQDYWCIEDRGAAIRYAVTLAHTGDIILACGKGHEQSMCFGTVEYPWDDRQAMALALEGKTLQTLPTSR